MWKDQRCTSDRCGSENTRGNHATGKCCSIFQVLFFFQLCSFLLRFPGVWYYPPTPVPHTFTLPHFPLLYFGAYTLETCSDFKYLLEIWNFIGHAVRFCGIGQHKCIQSQMLPLAQFHCLYTKNVLVCPVFFCKCL